MAIVHPKRELLSRQCRHRVEERECEARGALWTDKRLNEIKYTGLRLTITIRSAMTLEVNVFDKQS